MPENVVRSFDAPDETRDFEKGVLELIKVGPLTFGLETLEPGWRWSEHVKPLAGTELCEFHHVGYQVSGRWACEDRDGKLIEIGPGDIFDTPLATMPGLSATSHASRWTSRGSPTGRCAKPRLAS